MKNIQVKSSRIIAFLWAALCIVLLCSIRFGAVEISSLQMLRALNHLLQGQDPANIHEGVFLQLRLPRVLLCAITGGILALSGVLMQGLFRNPLVEPGLMGTSSGAALGASAVFVLGPMIGPSIKSAAGPFLVPVFAFVGALGATTLVYGLTRTRHTTSALTLLLTGVAVNAMTLSGTGFLSYVARDPQARSITFWNLGSFSGASLLQVAIVLPVGFTAIIIARNYAKHLNAYALGEGNALLLGINPNKTKKYLLLCNTLMVAVATSFVGVISFVGMIIPHMLRILLGSDNRKLIPASLPAGALLLTLADLLARLLLAPAEIPIGIITSLAGAPMMILLLKKFMRNDLPE